MSLTTNLAGLTSDGDANGQMLRIGLSLGNQLLSFGQGANSTTSLTANPPLGSSPAIPENNATPPLRPDVPCETQPAPTFQSRAQAPRGIRRTLTPAQSADARTAMSDTIATASDLGEITRKKGPAAGTRFVEEQLRMLLGGDDDVKKKAEAQKSSSVSDSAAKTADSLTNLGGAGR